MLAVAVLAGMAVGEEDHKGEAAPVAAQHNAGHIVCWVVCTVKARRRQPEAYAVETSHSVTVLYFQACAI